MVGGNLVVLNHRLVETVSAYMHVHKMWTLWKLLYNNNIKKNARVVLSFMLNSTITQIFFP